MYAYIIVPITVLVKCNALRFVDLVELAGREGCQNVVQGLFKDRDEA